MYLHTQTLTHLGLQIFTSLFSLLLNFLHAVPQQGLEVWNGLKAKIHAVFYYEHISRGKWIILLLHWMHSIAATFIIS